MLPAAAGPYDVTLVSPRNYFLYTPLLPSAATGTVEPRSIVDPVRSHIPDTVCPASSLVPCRSAVVIKVMPGSPQGAHAHNASDYYDTL